MVNRYVTTYINLIRLLTWGATNRDMSLFMKSRLWGCYKTRHVTKRDVFLLATLRYAQRRSSRISITICWTGTIQYQHMMMGFYFYSRYVKCVGANPSVAGIPSRKLDRAIWTAVDNSSHSLQIPKVEGRTKFMPLIFYPKLQIVGSI